MKNIIWALWILLLGGLPVRCQESAGLEALTGKNIRPSYIISGDKRTQIESVSYPPAVLENERGERILAVTNYGWEGVSYDLNDRQLYASISLAGPFLVEVDEGGNPYLTQIFMKGEMGKSNIFTPGWISPTDRTIEGVNEQKGDYISYCTADKKKYVVIGRRPCTQKHTQDCSYLHAWYVDEVSGLRRKLRSKQMNMQDTFAAPSNTVYCDGEYFYFTADRLESNIRNGFMRGIWVYDLKDDKIYEFLADPFVYNGKNGFRSYAKDPVAVPGTDYMFYLRTCAGEKAETGETEGVFMRLSVKKKFTRPKTVK